MFIAEQDKKEELKEGVKLTRRVVRDKPIYEYEIILLEKPTSFKALCDLKYSFEQIENIILHKEVEDKILDAKREELE